MRDRNAKEWVADIKSNVCATRGILADKLLAALKAQEK